MTNSPPVSVIIPLYGNSTATLLKCIRALESQTYPLHLIEVLVVDNNKTPVIGTRLESVLKIKILHEPVEGSYSARNLGIEKSENDVLAFTDSDCVPHIDWLKNGVSTLSALNFTTVIGGSIVMTFQNPLVPNSKEKYDDFFHLEQESYVTRDKFAATANLISPRFIFRKYGYFNTNLYSGGDREWGEKISTFGVQLFFAREAIVYHPARSTVRAIIKKNRRIVGGEYSRLGALHSGRTQILIAEIHKFKVKAGMLKNTLHPFNKIEIGKLSVLLCLVHLARFGEAIRLLIGGRPQR